MLLLAGFPNTRVRMPAAKRLLSENPKKANRSRSADLVLMHFAGCHSAEGSDEESLSLPVRHGENRDSSLRWE
jgi:hypothetical protein